MNTIQGKIKIIREIEKQLFQMEYWAGIPTVMFGTMGIIASLLVLTQPETLGVKMPDTLAEAEALGKPEFKRTG